MGRLVDSDGRQDRGLGQSRCRHPDPVARQEVVS